MCPLSPCRCRPSDALRNVLYEVHTAAVADDAFLHIQLVFEGSDDGVCSTHVLSTHVEHAGVPHNFRGEILAILHAAVLNYRDCEDNGPLKA